MDRNNNAEIYVRGSFWSLVMGNCEVSHIKFIYENFCLEIFNWFFCSKWKKMKMLKYFFQKIFFFDFSLYWLNSCVQSLSLVNVSEVGMTGSCMKQKKTKKKNFFERNISAFIFFCIWDKKINWIFPNKNFQIWTLCD